MQQLRDASKDALGYGYRIVWQTRRSRTHGLNRFPDAIEWLKQNQVYYWGDLDAEVFAILDRLRQLLPATQSLLMDRSTVDQFLHLATLGNAAAAKTLVNLSDQEHLPMQRFFG